MVWERLFSRLLAVLMFSMSQSAFQALIILGFQLLAFSGIALGQVVGGLQDADGPQFTIEQMTSPMGDAATLLTRVASQPSTDPPSMMPELRIAIDNGFAWQGEVYFWSSPVFAHNPLYFEQTKLERYGWDSPRCLHPAMSAIHFYGSLGSLPVKALFTPPHRCVSTVNNDRPGTCRLSY